MNEALELNSTLDIGLFGQLLSNALHWRQLSRFDMYQRTYQYRTSDSICWAGFARIFHCVFDRIVSVNKGSWNENRRGCADASRGKLDLDDFDALRLCSTTFLPRLSRQILYISFLFHLPCRFAFENTLLEWPHRTIFKTIVFIHLHLGNRNRNRLNSSFIRKHSNCSSDIQTHQSTSPLLEDHTVSATMVTFYCPSDVSGVNVGGCATSQSVQLMLE